MICVVGPGGTIGILGAGQLGRMLAVSARQMGYRVAVFGGESDSPAGQVSDLAWTGAFDDEEKFWLVFSCHAGIRCLCRMEYAVYASCTKLL